MERLYKKMGLIEVTTKRQKKNGTRMFKDKKLKDVYYTFHESGYFRRRTRAFPFNLAFCGRKFDHYQLNRTKINKKGNTVRILEFNPIWQMVLALRPIRLYRLKKGL